MASKSLVFSFDDVEVREREYSIIKGGEVLAVEPKAFRVLLFLLRNPGKLIAKEELLNAVWGDAAVTDSSLVRSVALLRRLLGDETRNPRYIETVATVGYRIVCKVEVSEDATAVRDGSVEPEDEAKLETPIPGNLDNKLGGKLKSTPKGLRWWLVAGAGILAAGLTVAVWCLRRPLPPPHISAYTQITNDGRMKAFLGTDGNRIYITKSSPNSIAQVAITGGEVVPIPVAVPGERYFLWDVSRDGSSFLIASVEANFDISIWIVPILGGSARRLGQGVGAAFSPDGSSVAYSTWGGDLYRVRSDGTETRKLAMVGGDASSIAWSPDGGSIRFTRDRKLWEISSDGTGLRQLLPGWQGSSSPCCGHWTPDGRFYLFQARKSDGAGSEIWALDERRGPFRQPPPEPTQLTTGPFSWSYSIPSKDGKKIFANGMAQRVELVRLDQQTRQTQPFLGGISAEFVSFSHDGQFVAYVSFPEGNLWRANRDGSNPVQLSEPPMYPMVPRWSPDGTSILFFADHSVGYVVSAEGGSPQRILPGDAGEQNDPNWSPDGRKIVFDVGGEGTSKNENLRILDLASHQVTAVPGSVGLYSPRWSPDGRHLAALSSVAPMLRVFDMETQRWSALPAKGNVDFPSFSRDGQSIYFIRFGIDQGVFRISLKGGEPEKTWDLKDWHLGGLYGFSMSLDPTDAPLVPRDIGSQDIYALTLEEK